MSSELGIDRDNEKYTRDIKKSVWINVWIKQPIADAATAPQREQQRMMRKRQKASDEENKRKPYGTFYSNVRIVSFNKKDKEKR